VPAISAVEAHQRIQDNPNTLVIDVRDAADIPATGIIPGAINISYGSLTYMADNVVPPEWRASELEDRARPIITTCTSGELAALAAKLLKDMGFTNVSPLAGGTLAWKDAGFPTNVVQESTMPITFPQMVTKALAEVPAISAVEAHQRIQDNPNTLVIDVRDAADIPATGIIPGAINISYGSLTYMADNVVPPEWRAPELQDRSRPIITTCTSGELAALAAKLLKDMGFTNVSPLAGGTLAWKDAGFPTK
jgi:rhodanese-related sulfurtransferase